MQKETQDRIIISQQHYDIFPTNAIRNYKYTALSFLPKNLFYQFRSFYSIYFIIIGIIQIFPIFTTVNWATTWGPIIAIFLISAIKELIDDLIRHHNDRKFNSRIVDVYRDSQWTQIPSKDIKVGDLVRIQSGEEAPCDLLLVQSSQPNAPSYIQTTNIDGESDFKRRIVPPSLRTKTEDDIVKNILIVSCSPPNSNANSFLGSMHDTGHSYNDLIQSNPFLAQKAATRRNTDYVIAEAIGKIICTRTDALSIDHFFPQGCVLKSLNSIIGLAVYTGNETKMGCAKKTPPLKRTNFDRMFSRMTFVIFLIQLVFVIILAICALIWRASIGRRLPYLFYNQEEWTFSFNLETLAFFLRFLTLISIYIPVSLKVTLDLIKLFSALYVVWDLRFWNENRSQGSYARSTAITEELGQITHVITDKTGTLTENIMEMTGCGIGSMKFGMTGDYHASLSVDEADKINEDAKGYLSLFEKDETLKGKLAQRDPHIVEFFRTILLCNSVEPHYDVVPSFNEHTIGSIPNPVSFFSSNPDEQSMINTSMKLGFRLLFRSETFVVLDILGELEIYEMLTMIQFQSQTKRMTVIVHKISVAEFDQRKNDMDLANKLTAWNQIPSSDTISVFTKGAPDVLMPRCLDFDLTNFENPLVPRTSLVTSVSSLEALNNNVTHFSRQGFRTLAMCKSTLTPQFFRAWHQEYHESITAQKDRQSRIDATVDKIEKQFRPLGVASITDRIQEGVPETINKLRQSGIRVWMVTGDHAETSKQIALATSISGPNVLELKGVTPIEWLGSLHPYRLQVIQEPETFFDPLDLVNTPLDLPRPLTVVLEGTIFEKAVTSPNFADDMTTIMSIADSVVIYRAAPKQKATVTRYCKTIKLPPNDAAFSNKPSETVTAKLRQKQRRQRDIDRRRIEQEAKTKTLLSAADRQKRKREEKERRILEAQEQEQEEMEEEKEERMDALVEHELFKTDVHYVTLATTRRADTMPLVDQVTSSHTLTTPQPKKKSGAMRTQIRRFFTSGRYATVLTIGDGGNDVPMLQEGDVGVGIDGEEGKQACLASDFSFTQFRNLQPLLFIHGRQSLRRIWYITCYSMYKSVLIATIQALYNFWAGFSGISFFDSLQLTLFNLLYTSFPIAFFLMDQDIPPATALTRTRTYRQPFARNSYNWGYLLRWELRGMFQALVISLVNLLVFYDTDYTKGFVANLSFICVLVILSLTLVADSTTINIWQWLVILISALLVLPINLISSQTSKAVDAVHQFQNSFSDGLTYTVIFIDVIICLGLLWIHEYMSKIGMYHSLWKNLTINKKIKNAQKKVELEHWHRGGARRNKKQKR
ncbi:phospholipid-transporting P-type ATPase [Blattamonas nauphoetae]|uniref:Phospholipid-transporting ATPase n=1 Tax=Blattamonas nauphoetae TaxID=2049346 RepID=A0ABQ9XPN3_9EUKA|nr:phospholipid-transporting P-type ATPase [Blattamonas nauphoetae]